MLWFSAALAGFYHPSDVAGSSEVFASASARAGDGAGEVQRKARSLAAALADFEEANDLLDLPQDRHATLEKQYNHAFAKLQAHADVQVEDFDAAFGAALARALTAHPDAVRCQRELPVGRSLPGRAPRMERNAECKGDDLNAGLAAAMDADSALRAELDRVQSRPWPALEIDKSPLPGTRWISAPIFFQAAMGRALSKLRNTDEDERLGFHVAIEQGAGKDELAALIAKAQAVDAATRARRQGISQPVISRATQVFAKKAPDAAWCPQPAVLGGCEGTDDTAALKDLLMADKKIQKSLP